MIHPGFVLGGYRVVKPLGQGGFAQTFEVDDGGTPKVLKVLNLDYFIDVESQQKVVSLFQREAEVLSQLDHPGIPRGEPNGYFTFRPRGRLEPLHCLVMERIDGQNLQEWLSQQGNKPISQEQAIVWLKQLVEILEIVHQQQYFHRDIKPSNIMVKPDGQLVLIDFGAVRLVSATYLAKIGGRHGGTRVSSAGYTPPEQADGEAVPQSDFFALGRTFVYLLTGKQPFEFTKNPQTGELIWREGATQVSQSLADLIDYLMATFPGQRPQNTQVILQHLEAIAIGFPIISQNPAVVTSTDQEGIGRSKTQSSSVGQLNINGVKFGLATLLLLGILYFPFASPHMAIDLNDRGVKNYRAGRLDKAQFYYRLALMLDPNLVDTHYSLGMLYEDLQDFKQARFEYQIAVKGDFDKAYSNLARLDILDKKYTEAIPLLEKGLQLAEDDKVKYALLKNLGWAQLELGHYGDAEANLRAAIGLASKRASAYCLLAQVLERQGNKKNVIGVWKNCLDNADDNNPDEKKWQYIALQRLKARGSEP